jgi:dynein heavy chain
VFNFP